MLGVDGTAMAVREDTKGSASEHRDRPTDTRKALQGNSPGGSPKGARPKHRKKHAPGDPSGGTRMGPLEAPLWERSGVIPTRGPPKEPRGGALEGSH